MAKKLTVKESKTETDTLIALATNDTITDAAKQLGVSRTVVYERIHKYGLDEQLANIQKTARAELLTATSKAARNLVKKIDHEDANVSLKASTETLDRAGLTKPNKLQTGTTVNNFGTIVAEMKDKYAD